MPKRKLLYPPLHYFRLDQPLGPEGAMTILSRKDKAIAKLNLGPDNLVFDPGASASEKTEFSETYLMFLHLKKYLLGQAHIEKELAKRYWKVAYSDYRKEYEEKHALGQIIHSIKGLADDNVERGYRLEKEEGLRGLCRRKVFSDTRPPSIFVVVEPDSTPEGIARTTCHEYYHARIARHILPSEGEEAEADAFADRVLKEMAEVKVREARERWLAEYQELQKRRK